MFPRLCLLLSTLFFKCFISNDAYVPCLSPFVYTWGLTVISFVGLKVN